VVCCSVPGHCGLPGNEAANAAVMHGPRVTDRALGTERFTCPRHSILSSWQAEWHSAYGNKLRVVKPYVQQRLSSFRAARKGTATLARQTHGHLLRGGPEPVCAHCGVHLTVARISVDCPRYTGARRDCHLDGTISDIRVGPPMFWRLFLHGFAERFKGYVLFSCRFRIFVFMSCFRSLQCQAPLQPGKFRSY
jgi:hypothetical protein